jgi:ubiquitin carboxyl-terminal hydrolase MINDY-3/4
MEQKLDPEGLGIVLLYAFMEEFYPQETSSVPDVFTIWHYNGLSRSNTEGKVMSEKDEINRLFAEQ